jgi:hypothetical protein
MAMVKNYLDIIDDDLLNKIFGIVADLYEKDIQKTNNKLRKVKSLVEGLHIDIEADYVDYITYYINYYNIYYCINKYIYSRYPLDNVVIVLRLQLIVYYNSYYNTHEPIILRSEKMRTPIYLDILREIHKLYMKQKEISGHSDKRLYLENIIPVEESEYEYYKITPSPDSKINYIKYECCS